MATMAGVKAGGKHFLGEPSSLMDVRGELKLLEGAVLGVRQKLPPPPMPASMLPNEVFSLEVRNWEN